MLARIIPFTMLLILGPIFCLSLIASYSPVFAFILVVSLILIQGVCTKFLYFHGAAAKRIIKFFYKGSTSFGRKEGHKIIGISALTSWIAPCTVWVQRNTYGTPWHLISSSSVTMAIYILSLLTLGVLENHLTFDQEEYLPITHCFTNDSLIRNPSKIYCNSALFCNPFSLSTGNELPKVRICSANEEAPDLLNALLIFGACLCVVSFSIAIWLWNIAGNSIAYHCPKSFSKFVTAVLIQEGVLTAEKLKRIEEELEKLQMQKDFVRAASFSVANYKIYQMTPLEIPEIQQWENRLAEYVEEKRIWGSCPPLHKFLVEKKIKTFITLCAFGGKPDAENGQIQSPLILMEQLLESQFKVGSRWILQNLLNVHDLSGI